MFRIAQNLWIDHRRAEKSRGEVVDIEVIDDLLICDGRVIAENLSRARVADRGAVVRRDVIAYLAERAGEDGPFDVVLLDPPYAASDLLESTLARLAAPTAAGSAVLRPDAWVVAKHFWRTPLPQAVGLLASVRTRRFGETALTFYRYAEAEPTDEERVSEVTP